MKSLFASAIAAFLCAVFTQNQTAPVAPKPGSSVELPAVKSVDGAAVALPKGDPSVKGVAICFTAAHCPIATAQLPALVALARQYSEEGVRFYFVDPNAKESAEDLKELEARIHGAGPLIHDAEQLWTRALRVSRTTEAFVLDGAGLLRYRGAFDDQFALGTRKPEPQRHYVKEALVAVLAGKAPALVETEPKGCLITPAARPAVAPPPGDINYHEHVAPVLRKHCVECHRPGEIGPMPLLSYDDADTAAAMIAEVVDQRRMPPWHANPQFGSWKNARGLSEEERSTLIRWASGSRAEGPKPAKPVETAPSAPTWHIGKPDLVLTIPKQRIPASGKIDYHYVEVPTGLTEDRWVTAAEVHAGAREVVHHALIFVIYPKDRRDEQPPIDGGLNGGFFASLVPGERPNQWPAGTGKLLPAGSALLFQMHYTADGTAREDASQIGLVFAKEPPARRVVNRGIHQRKLNIPPGASAARFEARWKVPRDVELLAFLPHMHYRGKSFRYVLEHPDGREETLLDVPRYDFGWQATYIPEKPLQISGGSIVRCVAVFDNSAANLANPNPKATVRWGEQSWDEMLIGYVDYVEK